MDFDLTKTENLLIQISDLSGKIVESFLKENISAGKQQIIYKTNPLGKGSYLIDLNISYKHSTTQLYIKE